MPPPVPSVPALIRLAAAADLPAINAIYNHYVLHSTCTYQLTTSTAEERQAWFAQHETGGVGSAVGGVYPVTVAQAGGEILGWASLSPFHPRPAYRFTVENSVYVHPDWPRRGLGRALLTDLLRRSDALGYRNIIALISADQEASLSLHRHLGFVEAGRLVNVGFKFERWLDVVYMQRQRPG